MNLIAAIFMNLGESWTLDMLEFWKRTERRGDLTSGAVLQEKPTHFPVLRHTHILFDHVVAIAPKGMCPNLAVKLQGAWEGSSNICI